MNPRGRNPFIKELFHNSIASKMQRPSCSFEEGIKAVAGEDSRLSQPHLGPGKTAQPHRWGPTPLCCGAQVQVWQHHTLLDTLGANESSPTMINQYLKMLPNVLWGTKPS